MTVVLDASALLAVFHKETGWEQVDRELDDAVISAVNFSEVIAKVEERGYPSDMIRESLAGSSLDIAPFDEPAAYVAGKLRPSTKAAGLSFADRVCLALAKMRTLPVLTADRRMTTLDLGLEVRVIR
jgi:ribonuclease VapC